MTSTLRATTFLTRRFRIGRFCLNRWGAQLGSPSRLTPVASRYDARCPLAEHLANRNELRPRERWLATEVWRVLAAFGVLDRARHRPAACRIGACPAAARRAGWSCGSSLMFGCFFPSAAGASGKMSGAAGYDAENAPDGPFLPAWPESRPGPVEGQLLWARAQH
jgi:hypothetical protein